MNTTDMDYFTTYLIAGIIEIAVVLIVLVYLHRIDSKLSAIITALEWFWKKFGENDKEND